MKTVRLPAWWSVAVVVALCCAGCDRRDDRVGGGEIRPVRIVVSGDTGGWLTPCGCASNQSGGLPRRGSYLADLGRSFEVIYLDAGGASGGTSDYHREKFEAILRGEMRMGLAGHNLGRSELAMGVDYLRDVVKRLSAPLLSANVVDETGAPVFTDLRVASAGGMKVAVVGVVSRGLVPAGVRAADPRARGFTWTRTASRAIRRALRCPGGLSGSRAVRAGWAWGARAATGRRRRT